MVVVEQISVWSLNSERFESNFAPASGNLHEEPREKEHYFIALQILLCTVELLKVFEQKHVEHLNIIAVATLDEVEDGLELSMLAYFSGVQHEHLDLLEVFRLAEVVGAEEVAKEVEVASGEELLVDLLVYVVSGVTWFDLAPFEVLEELRVILEQVEEDLSERKLPKIDDTDLVVSLGEGLVEERILPDEHAPPEIDDLHFQIGIR